MAVICSTEILVGFQRTSWRYIPEVSTLHELCFISHYMRMLSILPVAFHTNNNFENKNLYLYQLKPHVVSVSCCHFFIPCSFFAQFPRISIERALLFFFSLSLALQPPWALASDFQFHDYFTDGRTPWTSDQLVARPLPKHRTTETQNKHEHIPCVGFEPTIPASERAKTVHGSDR
jgi:hypothetical protein